MNLKKNARTKKPYIYETEHINGHGKKKNKSLYNTSCVLLGE